MGYLFYKQATDAVSWGARNQRLSGAGLRLRLAEGLESGTRLFTVVRSSRRERDSSGNRGDEALCGLAPL